MLSKESRQQFLYANWSDIAAETYAGFIKMGRGCLVVSIGPTIFHDQDHGTAIIKTAYIPAAEITEQVNDITNLKQMLADYDPITEVAICFVDMEGNYELVRAAVLDFSKHQIERLSDAVPAVKVLHENRVRAVQTVDVKPGFKKSVYLS